MDKLDYLLLTFSILWILILNFIAAKRKSYNKKYSCKSSKYKYIFIFALFSGIPWIFLTLYRYFIHDRYKRGFIKLYFPIKIITSIIIGLFTGLLFYYIFTH